MSRGRLITVEGLDGAGKTTLARGLVDALAARGLAVRALREPGGVRAAERIRALVGDPSLTLGARTEALLYAAARAQLVEEAVIPLLDAGTWVVIDRFIDSSLAYQGTARGLGVEVVRALNAFATRDLEPDRTLLLRLPTAVSRARRTQRADESDRLEQEAESFFAAVAAGYDALAAAEPQRIRVLDASATPEAVLSGALAALADLLDGLSAGAEKR